MVKTSYPEEIQIFFSEIVERIKEILDPDLILLAGSFGKESWLYFEDELISDFEFVFVCKKRWSLTRKKLLLKTLNKEYPYDISLKGYMVQKVHKKVISNYSSNNPGYIDLNFFDTFSNPKIIYSKYDYTLEMDIDIREVPAWEAWRLYVNRMGEILSLSGREKKPKYLENYLWLKIFESTADAYLIINNSYSKNIHERFNFFNNDMLIRNPNLSKKCIDSFSIIRTALFARKEHNLGNFDISNVSETKRINIINDWMAYFESKVLFEEKYQINTSFLEGYFQSKTIQKKYLEVSNTFSVSISNFIRLLFHHKKLLHLNFKFYNFRNSWRHLILLGVSSTFQEKNSNSSNYPISKKIMSKILRGKKIYNLSNEDFEKRVFEYWKLLR